LIELQCAAELLILSGFQQGRNMKLLDILSIKNKLALMVIVPLLAMLYFSTDLLLEKRPTPTATNLRIT